MEAKLTIISIKLEYRIGSSNEGRIKLPIIEFKENFRFLNFNLILFYLYSMNFEEVTFEYFLYITFHFS